MNENSRSNAMMDGMEKRNLATLVRASANRMQSAIAEPERNIQIFIVDFLNYLSVERGLAESTLAAYRTDLAAFHVFIAQKNIELNKATRETVIAFLMFEKSRGASEATLSRLLYAIRGYAVFCFQNKFIQSDSVCKLEARKPEHKLPVTLSEKEVKTLLESVKIGGVIFQKRYRLWRDRSILELLYATGIRVSELCNIKIGDVNFSEKTIRVFGKGSKERIVLFHDQAMRCLQRSRFYLEKMTHLKFNNDDPLIISRVKEGKPQPFSRQHIWQLVKHYAQLAGIQKAVHPHTLRHSFASHILSGGADLMVVRELLGHSSVDTTMLYTHVAIDRLIEVHRRFHPRQ